MSDELLAALIAIRELPGPDSHQSDEFRRGWLSALQAAYDLMPAIARVDPGLAEHRREKAREAAADLREHQSDYTEGYP